MNDITEEELFDTDNWLDFGLSDHLEDDTKFAGWYHIAVEAARIAGAEEGSPLAELMLTVAAASAKAGFGAPFTK